MGPELAEMVEGLYENILINAQSFLDNVQTIDIKVLKKKDNPTFGEIAASMDRVAEIIGSLVGEFDPHLAGQALEYVFFMKMMALAIVEGDSEELARLAAELETKPFVLSVRPS